ncbi:hypothetical protein [Marimonas lutisalis]|uniref:hypothetical protein n=1 Tax=Marimonas lutisalis TaxID=2545756 RepID=UPI0010F99E74|nr:hypothetical protein [Marimonas lutisalis]
MPAIAILVAACLAWLILFQLLLALGAPLGHMAWGGAHRVLPMPLRLASGMSAGVLCVALAAVGQAGGWISWLAPGVMRLALGGFAVLFALSLLGNLTSQSRAERRHGVPLAAVLSAGFAALAVLA